MTNDSPKSPRSRSKKKKPKVRPRRNGRAIPLRELPPSLDPFVPAPPGIEGGRPSKLCRELVDELCETLLKGVYLDTACHCAGVVPQTVYGWMELGRAAKEAGDAENPHGKFLDAITKAMADAERSYVDAVKRAADGTPVKPGWRDPDARAAIQFLERRYQDKYGRRQQIDIGGAKDAPPVRLGITVYMPAEDGVGPPDEKKE